MLNTRPMVSASHFWRLNGGGAASLRKAGALGAAGVGSAMIGRLADGLGIGFGAGCGFGVGFDEVEADGSGELNEDGEPAVWSLARRFKRIYENWWDLDMAQTKQGSESRTRSASS